MTALLWVGRERLAWLVLLAAAVALNVVLLGGSRSSGAELTAEERQAAASAKARVGAMLTFSHTDLETDLGVASSNTTGSFRKQYADLLRSMVLKVANDRKVTTRSRVTSAAVKRSSPGQVQVLALLESRTTVGSKKPVLTRGRLLVTLMDVKGQWLVSGMVPR